MNVSSLYIVLCIVASAENWDAVLRMSCGCLEADSCVMSG